MIRRIALLLPLLLLRMNEADGCGPDYTTGEDFRFWLLQPEIAEARALHPFHFTTEVLNGPDFQQIIELPYAANIAEWKAVVGRDVPDEAITAVLYGMPSTVYFAQEEALFRSNAFLRRLAQLKGGWAGYVHFAKVCEQLVNDLDPWGFAQHDVTGIHKAWAVGHVLLKQASDPRLRARIAYQLVRVAHYGRDDNTAALNARPVYEKHLLPLRGKSWLEPSAAFYLASMLPNPDRDLAYAEIFDRASDKQFRMVQLFVSRSTDAYLELATSDAQRASLLVMRSLQHPGRALADLERIAAWDSGNRHLPMLLGREVNKLEDWLLTTTLTEYGAAIRLWGDTEEGVSEADVLRADLNYLHQVKAFIARITPQADADQRPLLTLLDGHLCLVDGDLSGCRAAMARVEQDPHATAMARMQARTDRVLCGIVAGRKLTDETCADILAAVELANTGAEWPGRGMMLSQMHLYLGKKLIERGEVAEGVFLLARSDRDHGAVQPLYWYSKNARHVAFERAAPADLDRMIALLDKPDKTPFERYLTATNEWPEGWEHTERTFADNGLSRWKLLDYKATWYMVRGRVAEAAAIFRQIPDDFWAGEPYAMFAGDDPFLVDLWDPYNYGDRDSTHYNKRTIAERMVALEREAERDPKKRALNNYLLGNAWYNMSWHGKYWIMSRIAWSMHEMGYRHDPLEQTSTNDDYFGCQRAKAYYLTAMNSAKDTKLKAMACRMAGACERNWMRYTGRDLDAWTNPYPAMLKDRRSRDAYDMICTGYDDFVRRFR